MVASRGMVRSLSLAVKRALDVTVALAALLVLSPLLALTALLILLEDGRPVFFRQNRAGLGGQPFSIFKFRSMRVNDAPVALMGAVTGAHPLVTRVGRVIRRTKIDELPQLLNVLKGDLSLVGPRPTLLEQVAEYDAFEQRRLSLKPGVTGWAQVCGGIYMPWEERIALDVWYIDHWSLLLDAEVLLRTVGVIVLGERLNRGALAAALAHERDQGHGAVRVGGWRSERPTV
jgi:lipopolysaccharide/colanic/teichoic acid biosynthesis glycosyltransferase